MSVSLGKVGKPVLKHLTLKKIYIEQIRAGLKTIEGRIFERSVIKLKAGDRVRFYYYSNAQDDVTCKVVHITKFKTFREMLEQKGYQKCIPNAVNLEAAIKQYASIPRYPEKEKKCGVVAIELEML